MLNVFPKKTLCIVILFASTSLTACGGGGGGGGGTSFSVTNDSQPVIQQNIGPFSPDPNVAAFDQTASEYRATPSLDAMGLTPFYALGLSGSGVTIGVLDSGVDGDHEELDGRVAGGGDWHGSGQGSDDPFGHGTHVASIIAAARNRLGIHGVRSRFNGIYSQEYWY